MSWLKTAGLTIVKIVGIASGFIPLAAQTASGSPTATKVIGEIQQIFNSVTTVEAVFAAVNGPDNQSGSTKLKAAVPLVAQVIQQSEAMLGKKIKNEAAFTAAVTAITSATADLLNSLE